MKPFPLGTVLVGDAAARLRELPAASVDMVLTSPPYFRLRDYQTDGQLGLEPDIDGWVAGLRGVARELARVLVPTGSLWLNLGDTYSVHLRQGAPRKSLLLGPQRLALALQRDGWLIRNQIVWAKTNPMPTPVRDRFSSTYEVVYVATRSPRYFFDLDAVRQPHRSRGHSVRKPPQGYPPTSWRGPNANQTNGLTALKAMGRVGHPLGKNPGDVWPPASAGYRGAHFATFPLHLAQRAIQAGCPESRCSTCRTPWRRKTLRALGGTAVRASLAPTCNCEADGEPGVVFDPFMGAGTTALAAEGLGRDWLGVELNPDFRDLTYERLAVHRRKTA